MTQKLEYDNIIEKYYPKVSDSYTVYYTHARAVTELALRIAENKSSLNADTGYLETAGMLHDIGIFMTDAPRIHCFGVFPYICHGYLGRQLLEKEGMADIAPVCERHIGTGITLHEIVSRELPLPHRDMCPQTIEEKIICYADKFYSKSAQDLTRPMSVEKVIRKLSRLGSDKVVRFKVFMDLFGTDYFS